MVVLKRAVILGTGGHAKVIVEIFRESEAFRLVGCLDQARSGSICGAPILGDDTRLPSLREDGVTHAFIAVGDNKLRAELAEKVQALGFLLAHAQGRHALVSPSIKMGAGVAIMNGAVINAEAVIEDLVIVNTNATIEHDCRVGRAAHVAPGAILTGNVTVGERAFIGAGSCILPGLSIGDRAIVGAGAVVTRNMPSDSLSWGVPAHPKSLHS